MRPKARLRRAKLLAAGATLAAAALMAGPALADFRLCNKTPSRVGVSVGYKEQGAWSTEGWWNVGANSCETLLRGPLSSRFYYVFAIDYDRGGEWNGKAYMCTRDKEYTIKGIEDCLARGYDRSGFFEIDTGEQKSWTVQLTEPGGGKGVQKPAAQAPLPAAPRASAGLEPGAVAQ